MMKKPISLIIILMTITGLKAQDHFSKSVREDIGYHNPAFIEMYEKFNIKGLYSINISKDRKYNPGIKFALNLSLEKISSGIGIHFDNYYYGGFFRHRHFAVNYGYHYKFNNNLSLGLGTDLSLNRLSFDNAIWMTSNSSSNDPIPDNILSYIIDIDMGIWIKYKEIQFGISTLHANQPNYSNPIYGDSFEWEENRLFNLICTYDIQINSIITMRNTGLYINNKLDKSPNILLSNIFVIRNTFQIGITTSYNDFGTEKYRFAPFLGVTLFDQYHLHLSKQSYNSPYNSSNTFELSFKYNIK